MGALKGTGSGNRLDSIGSIPGIGFRSSGLPAVGHSGGLLALLAFGLSNHEPGSPRWTWLFLLMPVALLRVVGKGGGRRWLEAWRYLALGLILLNFVPFIARQVQVLLYPQLEQVAFPIRDVRCSR